MKTNILVTGYNSLVGIGIIKSIKKSHYSNLINIYSTDYIKPIYFKKKDINGLKILPDIFKKKISKKIWLNNLIRYVKKNNIDYILIGIDFEIEIFSIFKQEIENSSNAKILVSNYSDIKKIIDKKILQENLKKYNFPYIRNIENIKNKSKIKFPLIIKAKRGTSSKYLSIIKNSKDLPDKIDKGFFAQSYISGADYTAGVVKYNDNFYTIVLKRLLKNGDTIKAIHKKSLTKKLSTFFCDVYKTFNFYGPINIQFKILREKPYIYEINPRLSGTTYIRTFFGFNDIDILMSNLVFKKAIKLSLNNGEVLRYYDEKKI